MQQGNSLGRVMRRTVLVAVAIVSVVVTAALLGHAAAFAQRSIVGTINLASNSAIWFDPGSNAGRPDVGGHPISVLIPPPDRREATVTIRPTNQTCWYRDVLRIRNHDTAPRNVCIRVTSAATLRPGDKAELYVFPSGQTRSVSGYPSPTFQDGFLARVNLLLSGSEGCFTMAGGGISVELDLLIYIGDDGHMRTQTSVTLEVRSWR